MMSQTNKSLIKFFSLYQSNLNYHNKEYFYEAVRDVLHLSNVID